MKQEKKQAKWNFLENPEKEIYYIKGNKSVQNRNYISMAQMPVEER